MPSKFNKKTPISPQILGATKDYYKSFTQWNDDYSSLKNKLNKLGWKKLGSGNYSDVYGNSNKPYILKINLNPDEGFAKFVQLTKKFPSKHFPRVGNLKYYVILGERYYIYLIEKLYPLPNASLIAEYINEVANDPDLQIKDLGEFYGNSTNFLRKLREFYKRYPSLLKAVRLLGRVAIKSNTLTFDMHSENIMKRSDGTIVIIDPFS